MPQQFNIKEVSKKFPVDYKESMSTVLVQEVIRYNRLLSIIHSSLQDLIKALKGLIVLSDSLDKLSNSIFVNIVPDMWAQVAYPSLKPLSAWIKDLIQRVAFIQKWIDYGIPSVFWISGLFFPQAFLTGVLQNYARKHTLPIDQLSFDFKIMDQSNFDQRPSDGCYIKGLFLEGARYDPVQKVLMPSKSKELYTEFPVIWLLPKSKRVKPTEKIYDCPVYKTILRAGTLSTTGHSTNYIMTIELPTEELPSFWIKRGVGLVCALNY
jgi:dynein heavy chain